MKYLFFLLLQIVSFQSFAQNGKKIKTLPAFTVTTFSGDTVDIREITKNKVAFINFWFIPCPPCLAEMRMLTQIHEQFKGDSNFIFISVSRANRASVDRLLEKNYSDTSLHNFMRYTGLDTLSYPIYYTIGCSDNASGFGDRFRISYVKSETNCPDGSFHLYGYPTNLIVDKKGRVVYNNSGYAINEKGERMIADRIVKVIRDNLKQ
jgi:thiol-disulfide isomerase/thioredoxin